mgnify:CR=1 FL=1
MKPSAMKMLLILLSFSLVLISCKKEPTSKPSKQQTFYGVSYGPHQRHKMDICLPKDRNENTPVVIFIHGGAWVFGDKSVFHTEMREFAEAGIACATINYRYASDFHGVHHPMLPQDVALAVEYISRKAGDWSIAPSSFGLVGHSAGGHLALLTAYSINTGKIKAVSSWAGPVDFLDTEQSSISGSNNVFATYIGSELNSASDTLTYLQASPFHVVQSNAVPTQLIYATEDTGVPYLNGLKMHEKLGLLGIINELVTQEGAGHIWFGNHLRNARSKTLEWFQSNLIP